MKKILLYLIAKFLELVNTAFIWLMFVVGIAIAMILFVMATIALLFNLILEEINEFAEKKLGIKISKE